MTHAAIQGFLKGGFGTRIEDRTKGTAGNKKRASWCGKMLSRATPDRADIRFMVMCALRRKNRSGMAGPSS